MGWYVSLLRWGGGVVEFVRGLSSSCGVRCTNVDWIVMVCSCGGGGVCVIRVVVVMGWLGSGCGCMVVVVLVMR